MLIATPRSVGRIAITISGSVPQIAHVVTSDRGTESVQRAARVRPTSSPPPRSLATAIAPSPMRLATVPASISSATARSAPWPPSAFVEARRSRCSCFVDGLPMAGGQIDDVDLEQIPVAGVDRIEVVEGGGSTLYGSGSIGGVINIITGRRRTTQHPRRLDRIVRRTIVCVYHAVSFVSTHVRDERLFDRRRTESRQCPGGLDGPNAAPCVEHRRLRSDVAGTLASALVGTPGELGYYPPTSEQSDSIATFASRSTRTRRTQSTLQLGVSSQDLGSPVTRRSIRTAPIRFIRRPHPDNRRIRHTRRCSTTSIGWRVGAPSPTMTKNAGLRHRPDARYRAHRRRYGRRITSQQITRRSSTPTPQTAAYAQSQWFDARGNQLYAGLRAERDGGIGGAFSPSARRNRAYIAGTAVAVQRGNRISRADRRGIVLSRLLEPESRPGAYARCRRDAQRAATYGTA